MNTTKEQRKEIAIKALKQLGIFKPYVDEFEKNDTVCFFERFAGFWVFQEPEIEAKMKEIEQRHNCTVFAITHEYTEFGECYSFLLVTDYPEEWNDTIVNDGDVFYAFAYVWNKDVEWCSEFGSVCLASRFGGLVRVA